MRISDWSSDVCSSDLARVMETMRVMFTAMADDDMARYRQVTTPDFYAFDIGRNMTSDQLIDVVDEARESGMTFYLQVQEPRVHIDGQKLGRASCRERVFEYE